MLKFKHIGFLILTQFVLGTFVYGQVLAPADYFHHPKNIALAKRISAGDAEAIVACFDEEIPVEVNNSVTPLHWCVIEENLQAFELLLEFGQRLSLGGGKEISALKKAGLTFNADSNVAVFVVQNALARPQFVEPMLRHLHNPAVENDSSQNLLQLYAKSVGLNDIDNEILYLFNLIGVDSNHLDSKGIGAFHIAIDSTKANVDENIAFKVMQIIKANAASKKSLPAQLSAFKEKLVEYQASPKGDALEFLRQAAPRECGIGVSLEQTRFHINVINMFDDNGKYASLLNELLIATQGLSGMRLNPNHSRRVREFSQILESHDDLNLPQRTGKFGFSFPFAAFLSGELTNFKLLLDIGVSPDLKLSDDLRKATPGTGRQIFYPQAGESVLMCACLNPFRRKEYVLPALAKTQAPNQLDPCGRNLLHRLLLYPLPREEQHVLEALLDSGVDINHQSLGGQSPAHTAVRHNPHLIPFLVEKGADLSLKNRQGQTVFDLLEEAVSDEWREGDQHQNALDSLGSERP